jgi:electron transfer flavoprotein-quinone oxidoreductase
MTSGAPDKFDVIVVGGGPAGLTCSYTLAKKGLRVAVMERGRTAGAKSLFGGRVYSSPLEKVYENFRKEAPIERWVKHEKISMVADDGAVSLDYDSNGSTSFTAYLPKLVAWMASRAETEGAVIVSDVRVDEVAMDDNGAVGVLASGDKINADVVVLAEGVNRLLCERMKVVPPLSLDQVALGVRQVIRLGSDKINERFGLAADEGLAWFFLGKPSDYLPGGGFLYTNSSTISLGLVLYLEPGSKMPDNQVYDILEKFRTSPTLGRLLAGGSLVEYGSHLIPEAGLTMMPDRLYGDGYVIVGDAAGLVLNLGYTVRGVDFAVHSGYLAAQAISDAYSSKDFSAEKLATYEEKLNHSFVVREMRRHNIIQKMMQKRYIFEAYPRILVDAARRLYEFDEISPKLLEAGRRSIKGRRSTIGVLSDLLTLARGP